MVLTEREELIISYMIVPSNRIKDVFTTYKSLSNEELKNIIDKMNDYMNEVGETYRSFGIYDEVYRLELTHVKELLLEEYQSRKIIKEKEVKRC